MLILWMFELILIHISPLRLFQISCLALVKFPLTKKKARFFVIWDSDNKAKIKFYFKKFQNKNSKDKKKNVSPTNKEPLSMQQFFFLRTSVKYIMSQRYRLAFLNTRYLFQNIFCLFILKPVSKQYKLKFVIVILPIFSLNVSFFQLLMTTSSVSWKLDLESLFFNLIFCLK